MFHEVRISISPAPSRVEENSAEDIHALRRKSVFKRLRNASIAATAV